MTNSVVMIVLGRQRVGKTTFINTAIQYMRKHGATFELWDGDQQNTSYNLSQFHPDTLRPPSHQFGEVRTWLMERFSDVMENRKSAVLDIGGGETPLSRLMDDAPIMEGLAECNVNVVLFHVIGPEAADLDYLTRFGENELFVSDRTVVVLNEGLVLTDMDAQRAFRANVRHPAISNVLKRGGCVVDMPRLECLSEIVARGLTYEAALKRETGTGSAPIDMFRAHDVASVVAAEDSGDVQRDSV